MYHRRNIFGGFATGNGGVVEWRYMAKQCPITRKTSAVGGGYSNRTRATKFNPTGKVRKNINVQKKKLFVPALGKYISVALTTKGLRTLKKQGVEKGLRSAGVV